MGKKRKKYTEDFRREVILKLKYLGRPQTNAQIFGCIGTTENSGTV